MIDFNLVEEVQDVVDLSKRRENTVVEQEQEEVDYEYEKHSEPFCLGNRHTNRPMPNRNARSMPSLQTQDSTQRLRSSDDVQPTQRKRHRQRRRRTLRDSITLFFSKKSSQKTCESFSLSTLVSNCRRKKNKRKTFSSFEFDLRDTGKMGRRRSGPLRQSSSTAFTSAALEVSENFRDDEKEETPFATHCIY